MSHSERASREEAIIATLSVFNVPASLHYALSGMMRELIEREGAVHILQGGEAIQSTSNIEAHLDMQLEQTKRLQREIKEIVSPVINPDEVSRFVPHLLLHALGTTQEIARK